MRTILAALVRQRRPAPAHICAGHHWHYRSPHTHLRAWRGSGWECCHCDQITAAAGPPPTHDVQTCAYLAGESERLDRVEGWLDFLAAGR